MTASKAAAVFGLLALSALSIVVVPLPWWTIPFLAGAVALVATEEEDA